MKLFAIGALAFFPGAVFTSFAGTHVGNGGDPVEHLMENARLDALIIIRQFRSTGVRLPDASQYQDVVDFLKRPVETGGTVAEAFEADLLKSRYFFMEDRKDAQPGQNTCARTNLLDPVLTPNDIRFSLKSCDSLLKLPNSKALARQLILHESSHHFGLTREEDESLAIRVGVFLDANAAAAETVFAPVLFPFERNGEIAGRLRAQGLQANNLPSKSACNRFLNSGSLLDLESRQWRALQPSPSSFAGRIEAFSAVFESADTSLANTKGPESIDKATSRLTKPNRRYVVWGGCSDSEASCRTKWADGMAYDPTSQVWEALPPGPAARSHGVQSFDGSKAFFYGGSEFLEGKETGLSDGGLLSWDGKQWTWKLVEGPHWDFLGRYQSAADRIADKIYIWGGCAKQGVFYCSNLLKDGAIFDLNSQTWEPISAPGFDIPARSKHSLTSVGQYLVLFGGEGKSGPLSDGAVYDTVRKTWAPLVLEKEYARSEHRVIKLGNEVLIVGGEKARGVLAEESFRLRFLPRESGLTWAQSESTAEKSRPFLQFLNRFASTGFAKKSTLPNSGLSSASDSKIRDFIWSGIGKSGEPSAEILEINSPASSKNLAE